jgi:hypothetical protein
MSIDDVKKTKIITKSSLYDLDYDAIRTKECNRDIF